MKIIVAEVEQSTESPDRDGCFEYVPTGQVLDSVGDVTEYMTVQSSRVLEVEGFTYKKPKIGEYYFSLTHNGFVKSDMNFTTIDMLVAISVGAYDKPRTALEIMHEQHQALWNWLADNPEKNKMNWPGWGEGYQRDDVLNQCFACEYAENQHGGCNNGRNCPIDWPGEHCQNGGLYSQWNLHTRPGTLTRSSVAREIANLPLKEGIE
jgi:hypothetical protein